MLGRRPQAADVTWEAMAEGLNGLGEPFSLNGRLFPPGEWVEVNAAEAGLLKHRSWAQLRMTESA